MGHLTIQQQVNVLWAEGRNPVHLFGNVYLVRYESTQFSKIPFYIIKVLREKVLDK